MLHVGTEQVIHIAGKPYRLARFSRGLFRRWLVWADSQLPDPVALATSVWDHWPEDFRQGLIDGAEAVAKDRLSFDDPVIMEMWGTEASARFCFGLLLEEHHPELPQWEADRLWACVTHFDRILSLAMGRLPSNPSSVQEDYLKELGLLPSRSVHSGDRQAWHEIDQHIFKYHNLTCDQIDKLTLPEILTLISAPPEEGFEEKVSRRLASARGYTQLNPRQRLALVARTYPPA
jgi:hypothetical protein